MNQPVSVTPKAETVATGTPGAGFIFMSWTLLVLAAFLVADGVWVMYSYDAIDAQGPVGGDAYNYLIYAARGAGIISAGVGSAAAAAAFAAMGVWAKLRSPA